MNLKELADRLFNELPHQAKGPYWGSYKSEYYRIINKQLKKAYDLGRQDATPKYSSSAHNLKSKFNLQGFIK